MNKRQSVLLLPLAALLAGCGAGVLGSTPTAPVNPTSGVGNITGNWQGTLVPSGGSGSTLFGSIDQSGGTTSAGQFTTSVLHVEDSCYQNSPDIPAQGFVDGSSVVLNSFTVNQQNLVLKATANATGDAVTGTFSIFGGCANGLGGAFTASRYAALTGSYLAPAPLAVDGSGSIKLDLTQSTGADGGGGFQLQGTATFVGSPCFSSASLASGVFGRVTGSSFTVPMLTNEPSGSQISLWGSFDASATQISPLKYVVVGGSCAGTSGTVSAALAP